MDRMLGKAQAGRERDKASLDLLSFTNDAMHAVDISIPIVGQIASILASYYVICEDFPTNLNIFVLHEQTQSDDVVGCRHRDMCKAHKSE